MYTSTHSFCLNRAVTLRHKRIRHNHISSHYGKWRKDSDLRKKGFYLCVPWLVHKGDGKIGCEAVYCKFLPHSPCALPLITPITASLPTNNVCRKCNNGVRWVCLECCQVFTYYSRTRTCAPGME